MIAEPNSSPSTTRPVAPTQPVDSIVDTGALSATELYQLTLYKWRYSLEAFGFEPVQVRELMFIKWLHACHRVQP